MKDLAEFYGYLHKQNKGLFYHGTCSKANNANRAYALGDGKYLTWSKSMAEAYAKNGCKGTPIVETYKLPADLKLLDAQSNTMVEVKKGFGLKAWEYTGHPGQGRMMTEDIKRLGYDGVLSDKVADGLVVFDETKIKRIH